MKGRVTDEKACINVSFHQGNQPSRVIEFVIDTGFEGALALPASEVVGLALPFHQAITAHLADLSQCSVDAHRAVIDWHGELVAVAVLAMGEQPLLGTALLHGNDLHVRFDEGGEVVIEPIVR